MASKRNPCDNVTIMESYIAFLAMGSEQNDRRSQLIQDVVSDCDASCREMMCKVIRGMGLGQHDVEDLIQDILFRWSQQLEAGRKLPKPKALTWWFRVVARNAAIAHLRRGKGKWRVAEMESARRRFAAEQKKPSDDLAVRELRKVIRSILNQRCTPTMRRIFYLRLREKTYAEIADILNLRSEETVRNVMRRVQDILREELTRFGWVA